MNGRDLAWEMNAPPPFSRSQLLGYGVAVLAVAVIVILKWKVVPHVGSETPYLMLLAAALVATGYGGLGPGLLAAFLGTAAVSYLFLPWSEGGPLEPQAVLQTVGFAVEGVGAVALVAGVRSSRTRAEDSARRTRSIYEVSAALGRTRNTHEIADVVLHELVEVLGASAVAIFVPSDSGGPLRLVAYRAPGAWVMALVPLFPEISLDSQTIVASVAKSRTAVFIESLDQWRARFPESFAQIRKLVPARATLVAPMIVGDRLVGVQIVGFSQARRFSPADRFWMRALAQDSANALERSRLFDNEQRARGEAEEANRSKDEFLAVVSHELREPLTSIASWTRELRHCKGDRRRCEQGVRVIERSVQAQLRLIEGLLDLSRVVARELRVDVKGTDLSPLVRSSIEPLRFEAAVAGVDLEMGSRVEATVVADAPRLGQAIRHLVSNALRFTPPGGHVRVDAEVRDRRAVVRVRDDGNGIAPNELARIFGGGGRSSGPEQGPGIGLSIVKYIVEEQHGTLRIDSPGQGAGTTATVELPMADPGTGVIGVVSPPGFAEGAAPRLAGLRLLVVVDRIDKGEIIAEIVTKEGAEAWATVSTKDALEQLRRVSPDMIVSDLDAPEEDSFIRQVRALPAPAGTVPAVAYTESALEADVRRVLDAGYQQNLLTPPEPRALTAALARLRPPAEAE
jgi:K+-sensing histidine kinase KdpD/CheY-like chemotaxis protein